MYTLSALSIHTAGTSQGEAGGGDTVQTPNVAKKEAWVSEYNMFLDSDEEIPEDMTLIQWWGVRISDFEECTPTDFVILDDS